jgi:hypothetical protein
VHPLSTALFLVGYALALPLARRLPSIVTQQQRLAFAGHQLGVLVALIGWLSRGGYTVALAHLAWLIGTRIWFGLSGRSRHPTVDYESTP